MTRHVRAGIAAALVLAAPLFVGTAYSGLAAVGLAGAGSQGFTLDRFRETLLSPETWRSVGWSVATSGAATALATAAAVLVAVRVRASRAGRLLAVLPLSVPHVAAAFAALLMFEQSGLISRVTYAIGLTATPEDFPALVYNRAGTAVVLAFAWKELPYLSLTALAVLGDEVSDLESVARTLGATPRQVFRRVTWPVLWLGLSPAVLAAFAFLLGNYEMPALLAPSDPTPLPILTYERAVAPDLSRHGDAYVLGLLGLTISAVLVWAHSLWIARSALSER
jgi:putative spermidine/putrescine transport system permease protein